MKAVCLDTNPSNNTFVKLMCFSTTNAPLAIGLFKCEDGFQRIFPNFSPATHMHEIFEIIFEEASDPEDEHEGTILGMKETSQKISGANLLRLREGMDEYAGRPTGRP